MFGGLNDILPTPIDAENEEVLLELLKRKMKGASAVAVQLLHAMEERFGPDAREVVREMVRSQKRAPRHPTGLPEADLRGFTANLEKGCAGSHRWERVIDEPDRVGYLFTGCMWAEVYRELGEPELGLMMCASDEPAVKSFNPALGFSRTKVMMTGDDACGHVFFVEG